LHLFRVIGQFIAKAMLDSRIIDMSFNKVFLKLVIGEDVPVTIDTLKVAPFAKSIFWLQLKVSSIQLVDPDLASSLLRLQALALTPADQPNRINIEDLALDFTIPGYDIELKVSSHRIVRR
jgi:E3 ubiquitin-protein ligase TRIP12